MLKGYKFRIYPNKLQKEMIKKHIDCCRFIYNLSLELKIKAYEKDKLNISQFELNNLLPQLKVKYKWLKKVNSQSLQQENNHLDIAFKNFFRKTCKFPKFKSKKNIKNSFIVPQRFIVNFKTNKIKLPKIGYVKTIFDREFKGEVKSATVSMTNTDKYYISLLVNNHKPLPEKQKFDDNNTIGIDIGIKHFATLSNGQKIENPRYLFNSLQRLKILQKRTSKKVNHSKNRRKANLKVAKIHEIISNQRKDFIHKFTSKIVSENQAIAIETLNITGMMKNHNLAQHISDVSWSETFRQLEYKCDWYGKTLIQIGQFEPSSKICSNCGSMNKNLKLSDREWTCDNCKTNHDRDINAAINIKKFALQDQNLIKLNLSAPKELREELVEMFSIEER